jgi:hypothetical protein
MAPPDLPVAVGIEGSVFLVVTPHSVYANAGEGVLVRPPGGSWSDLLTACVSSPEAGAANYSLGLTLLASGDAVVRCGPLFRRLRPATGTGGILPRQEVQTLWESWLAPDLEPGLAQAACNSESGAAVADAAEALFFHCYDRVGRIEAGGELTWLLDPAVGRIHALIPGRPGELYVLGDKGVAMIR